MGVLTTILKAIGSPFGWGDVQEDLREEANRLLARIDDVLGDSQLSEELSDRVERIVQASENDPDEGLHELEKVRITIQEELERRLILAVELRAEANKLLGRIDDAWRYSAYSVGSDLRDRVEAVVEASEEDPEKGLEKFEKLRHLFCELELERRGWAPNDSIERQRELE